MATALTSYGFVADPGSVRLSTGRQVDWSLVDVARVDADTGKKVIPAGTVVSEVAGKLVPTADVASQVTDPAWGILIGEAREDAREHAKSGYGAYIGGHFYENVLPDSAGASLPGTMKTDLGGLFSFEDYQDTRLA